MTRQRKTAAPAVVTPVELITLPEGATFELPESGRKGLVLRTPSISSAYCRIWLRKDEPSEQTDDPPQKKSKPYEDIPISSSTLVLPTAQ